MCTQVICYNIQHSVMQVHRIHKSSTTMESLFLDYIEKLFRFIIFENKNIQIDVDCEEHVVEKTANMLMQYALCNTQHHFISNSNSKSIFYMYIGTNNGYCYAVFYVSSLQFHIILVIQIIIQQVIVWQKPLLKHNFGYCELLRTLYRNIQCLA